MCSDSLSPDNISVKLGTTTNLLYGYDASWLSESKGNNALFPPQKKALEEIEISPPAKTSAWSLPYVSLHDTPEELLSALLPYQTQNPSDDSKKQALPSGLLLIDDSDRDEAITKLFKTLNLKKSLIDEQCGYALVQIKRIDGEAAHPCNQMGVLIHPNPVSIPEEYGVTDTFKKGVASLKRIKERGDTLLPDAIDEKDANGYLDFYTQQGTHFVSKVTLGDVIFQVFVMPQERYKRVKKYYDNHPERLTGSHAIYFRQYTTDANTGAYGYVKDYGNILSFSQSAVLRKSVENGDWDESVYAETKSIFALFQDDASVTRRTLDADYTDVTTTMTDLTSLSLFIEHSRKLIWRRIFKSAVIQKYQNSIQPQLSSYCDCDIAGSLKQNDLPGFLTNIATPTVNSYKTSLDLSDLAFVASDKVKHFTLCSNFLNNSHAEPIRIPGDDLLICGQLLSLETEDYTTTIKVNDAAFDTLVFSAQHFYGAMLIQNSSNTDHFTLVDGLKYVTTESGPNGRYYVEVDGDVRKAPPPIHIDRLKSSIQFSYSFAESALNTVRSDAEQTLESFLRQSMLWITQLIPENTDDRDLLDLRVRALDRTHIEKDQALGTFVPILPYQEYQQQIDSILRYVSEIDKTIDHYHQDIETRKTRELVIDVAKELNKNIISSGELLSGYVEASMKQQQGLFEYYDSIITQKQNEKKRIETTMEELQAQLNSHKAEVTTAVLNYQQSIKDWIVKETVKEAVDAVTFALQVATDLFSLGTTIAIPASSIKSVAELGLNVQRIKKLLDVLNATYKLYEHTKAEIEKIRETQEAFSGAIGVLSANVNWDELSVGLDQVLSNGPDDKDVNSKKQAVVDAFQIYVMKQKTYNTAYANAQQIAGEIYNQQRQKELIGEQAKRLEELKTNLQPVRIQDLDTDNIDLIGMTGQLSVVRSEMMGVLSKAFTLKDEALQYTYLQPATAITSFDTLGINSALTTQEGNRIASLESLSQHQLTTTTPINIPVEIPVQKLKNGGVYTFELQPDVQAFFQYVDIRVKAVVAKIDGVKSTESGRYLLELVYNGRPFLDRSPERDTVVFNTLRRDRIYEYIVEGNKPKFSDKGESWSDGVNPITPFSSWEISLPATKTNKGISFEELTATVTLSFVVEARIHDIKKKMLEKALATAGTPPSADKLVADMQGKSVLNDWDVVFNMGLEKINTVLKEQYDKLKEDDKQYGGKITADTSVEGAKIGDILTYDLQKFNINYGYPELQFLTNNPKGGSLEMKITSGTVQAGKRYVGENTENDKEFLIMLAKQAGLPESAVKEEKIHGEIKLVLQFYNDSVPLDTKATLQSVINIEQVKGLVDGNENILSVVLDMSKGTFKAKDIQITMSDKQKDAFSDAVKTYFSNHPVKFIINHLDLSKFATLDDLKPHQFLFKAYQTKQGNRMLQLFIQTNKREAFDYVQTFISPDVPEPIPYDSECSLMINSRIFFGSVLPGSIARWKLHGEKPQELTATWNAKFTSATISGNVDLSSLDKYESTGGGYMQTRWKDFYYSYAPVGGNPVRWNLKDMTITAAIGGKLEMKLDKKDTFQFNEHVRIKKCNYGGCTPAGSRDKTYNTDVTLHVSASLPIKITGSEREQGIKIDMKSGNISASARTSGGGPCGSRDLQAKVNNEMKPQLDDQLTKNLDVNFSGVSVFALKNLLFPANNYINLQDVYVPGDLLILGKFTDSK